MNKRFKTIVLLATFSLLMSSCSVDMSGFFNGGSNQLVVQELPTKTEYDYGDFFEADGLVVTDKDGRPVSQYSLNPAEGDRLLNPGNIKVTVSKESYKSTSFTILVHEEEVDELTQAKRDAVDEINAYYATFDLDLYDEDGRSELLSIKNQAIADINNATSVEEVTEIVNLAKDAMDDVTQKTVDPNRHLVSIEVKAPHSIYYRVGDELDLNGLYVTATYDNSDVEEVVGYEVTTPNMTSAGVKIVTVSYKGQSDTFNITVKNKVTSGVYTVDVYATNDIHGQIYPESGRAGIGKLMTYIKNHDNDNTLIIDQGDTWQGSMYSNTNRGALVNDVMNYVQYDARTIGNHDFDWGQQYIAQNKSLDYLEYRTPCLSANLFEYNFALKEVGSRFVEELASKTATYTLQNGLKVGIVGVIGSDQITSIMTKYVEDVAFINHVNVIKSQAQQLRENGCDIVIASIHGGQEDVLGNDLKEYVDLVLCAHTHKSEVTDEDGLYYGQFGSYTSGVGHITLTYDCSQQDVTNTDMTYINANSINSMISTVDPTISGIIDKYVSKIEQDPDEVVASHVSGYFASGGELANMMCKAIYSQAKEEGIDVDLAYCNTARHNRNEDYWTYSDVYESFPFDNSIYIIDITYGELNNEIKKYNNVYWSPYFDGQVNSSDTIRVACIDYLAFHTNSSRYYDYFYHNAGEYVDVLSKNYREILIDWLDREGYKDGKLLAFDRFSSSLTHFSKKFNTDVSRLEFHANGTYTYQYASIGDYISSYYPEDNPTKIGWVFGGWYLDSGCTISADGAQISSPVTTLYARWI